MRMGDLGRGRDRCVSGCFFPWKNCCAWQIRAFLLDGLEERGTLLDCTALFGHAIALVYYPLEMSIGR
jgi:hypothetical protein